MNNTDNILEEFKECAYIPTKLSDIRYKYMPHCDDKTSYAMVERGWRRFGFVHFTPECKTCNECKTIRINVKRVSLCLRTTRWANELNKPNSSAKCDSSSRPYNYIYE